LESGYKILWTDHALAELNDTFAYLENNFSTNELRSLSLALDQTLSLIARDPDIFAYSDSSGIRKVTVAQFNTLYYRIEKKEVQVISFFSNRQDPGRRVL